MGKRFLILIALAVVFLFVWSAFSFRISDKTLGFSSSTEYNTYVLKNEYKLAPIIPDALGEVKFYIVPFQSLFFIDMKVSERNFETWCKEMSYTFDRDTNVVIPAIDEASGIEFKPITEGVTLHRKDGGQVEIGYDAESNHLYIRSYPRP